MSVHRYPTAALLPDYLRAGAGFVITAGPLPFLGGSPITQTVLGVLALVFAGFALSTGLRQATRVTCDDVGLSTEGPRSVSVPWGSIDRIALRYFSTRRDKTKGWMQLDVGGGGRTVRVDSGLEAFDDVAAAAFAQATARGIALDSATAANAQAAGLLPAPEETLAPGPTLATGAT